MSAYVAQNVRRVAAKASGSRRRARSAAVSRASLVGLEAPARSRNPTSTASGGVYNPRGGDGHHQVPPSQPLTRHAEQQVRHGYADGDLVEADLEVARRADPDVGAEQQSRSQRHGVSRAGRHDRTGELHEPHADVGGLVDEFQAVGVTELQRVQVEACGEHPRPAGQDDGSCVGLRRVQSLRQGVDELDAQHVHLAVVHRDERHVAHEAHGDRGLAHEGRPCSLGGRRAVLAPAPAWGRAKRARAYILAL